MKGVYGAILLFTVCLVGCSNQEPSNPARTWLSQAQAAAKQMAPYSFEMQLTQKLSGMPEVGDSNVEVRMQGRVEHNPLKLDQAIKSNIDGEESTLRSVVVPNAYYMYLPEFEEWSKLSKDVAAQNLETFSDFQVNPEQAFKDLQQLGDEWETEQSGQVVTIRYDGSGTETAGYVTGLLESTLGLTGEQSDILKSLAVQKLNIVVTMDAERHWPLTYRIESDMTIELEPGQKSVVNQTLSGTYSEHKAAAAVAVPKEAEAALDPEEMEEQLDLELE